MNYIVSPRTLSMSVSNCKGNCGNNCQQCSRLSACFGR